MFATLLLFVSIALAGESTATLTVTATVGPRFEEHVFADVPPAAVSTVTVDTVRIFAVEHVDGETVIYIDNVGDKPDPKVTVDGNLVSVDF